MLSIVVPAMLVGLLLLSKIGIVQADVYQARRSGHEHAVQRDTDSIAYSAEGSLVVYAALWDAMLGHVNLIANVQHTPAGVYGIKSCVYGCSATTVNMTQVETLAEVIEIWEWPGAPIHSQDGHYLPVRIRCTQPDFAAEWVMLRLDSGFILPLQHSLEYVSTEHVGRIGACVGPLYSDRELLRPWIDHNERLGVSHFHLYFTNNHPDADNTEAGVQASRRTTNRLVQPFSHPGLTWHEYQPPRSKVWYFAQAGVWNVCLWRLRYAHDFVMFLDVDEFLQLPQAGLTSLQSLPLFLDQHVPEDSPGAMFHSWKYRYLITSSPPSVGEQLQEEENRHGLRTQEQIVLTDDREPGCNPGCNGTCGDKVIVRPAWVQAMWVHWITAHTAPGGVSIIPCETAFMKHYQQHISKR